MADQAYVLPEMSWPEVKEALNTVELALIPVGSNEQHGPNIAVGDATYASAEAGEAMAQEIEDRLTAFLEDFLKD